MELVPDPAAARALAVGKSTLIRWAAEGYARPAVERPKHLGGRLWDVDDLRAQLTASGVLGRSCEGCGVALAPGARLDKRWCSSTCRTAAWQEANPERVTAAGGPTSYRRPDVACPYCNGTRRPHHRSCGAPDCRRLATNAAQRVFQARYKDEHGERHRDRFDKCYKPGWRQRNPEAAARSDQARRARKLAAETEPVDRLEVFERDRWRCQLCRKKVDRRLAWPHPRSASLDHVVPLADGGSHTKANVQLAHLECNVRKHTAGAPQQISLIG